MLFSPLLVLIMTQGVRYIQLVKRAGVKGSIDRIHHFFALMLYSGQNGTNAGIVWPVAQWPGIYKEL